MKKLDLHGLRHHAVEHIVENFILLEELPVKVITGNSSFMQAMVFKITDKHDLSWHYESHFNLGAIIITERI